MKGKAGLVLLVSLLAMAEMAAAQTAIQTTKEVIQTPDGIEIRDAKPIDFYPGVLIGSPKDYTVERVDIIYKKTDGNVTVTLASMTIKSGKLIDGYVLAAWSKDVSFGTIILPGKDGWRAVETDIAIFGNARTRTLITQSFKPTLSQHYASLMDAVAVAGRGEAYAKLKEMLGYVSEVVKRDLKEFDRVVESSKATVTVYSSGIGILGEQYVDSVSVATSAYYDYGGASVSGTYKSWKDYIDSMAINKITLDGSMSFSGLGASVEYEMWNSDIKIAEDSINVVRVWGLGAWWISGGGESKNYVSFSGIGAVGYMVEFYTDWFSRPDPPAVTVDVEARAGGDVNVDDNTLYL